MVLTDNMDCAKEFHVYVYVKRLVGQCNKVDKAKLKSLSYVSGTELSECVYVLPQGEGDIVVRLAALHQADICSINPL